MEKMSLLKLMYAQIMANDNNGIFQERCTTTFKT